MSTFILPASGAHWLDRCHEGIQRLEFDHPETWWFVKAQSRGTCYYAFEPEVWAWDFWFGPNEMEAAGSYLTPGKVRYGMLTELQMWDWLRRDGKDGTMGLIDWERRCVFTCSCLAYYDYLTRRHQYRVRDQRIKVRMARRVA